MTALRLGDFFRLQPLPFQHILEIRVAAEVQLVGPVEADAPLPEQVGEHPVHDGGADLALDVVADDRQPARLEPPPPLRIRGDEHGDAVHEGAAGLQRPLGVKFRRPLRTNRQIGHHHVRARGREDVGDIRLGLVRFIDLVAKIASEPVERPAAPDQNPGRRHGREALRVVGRSINRLRDIAADLGGVHVEGGGNLDVADVIAAEFDVHQARRRLVGLGVAVVGEALDEGRGAVPDADDPNAEFSRAQGDSS